MHLVVENARGSLRIPIRLFCSLATVFALAALDAHAVTIPTVPIGTPGNPADTRYDAMGFGSVGYNFRMGKTEVTNAEYVEFLNAVAATDTFALYNTIMSGTITRSGSSGSFSYSTNPGTENMPVNFVSWYDAVRFVNWLHNGQGGAGTTEDGAYTLLGGTPTPSNSNIRDVGARWWLPSEDEWYKAAYYNSANETYFNYPTASNSAPMGELPPGGANSANYWPAQRFSDVGAYDNSPSPYGTFDQGGNVSEWNEALVSGPLRGLRGGSVRSFANGLHASDRPFHTPSDRFTLIGFRVATIIPEPSTIVLLGFGVLLLGRRVRCNDGTRFLNPATQPD